jgi:ArsR family transcriptional regulator
MNRSKCAAACKALSDETRLEIIGMLSHGELCACELLEHLNVSQPTLSHHMKTLTACGLVEGTKRGSWVHYRLDDNSFDEMLVFIEKLTLHNRSSTPSKTTV